MVGNIKIIHLNVQGQRKKVSELEILLQLEDPDFFCVSEHWASDDEIVHLKLNGYSLSSFFCRSQYGRGGVSIYSKTKWNGLFSVLELSSCEKNF